jgi:hypothetical protein
MTLAESRRGGGVELSFLEFRTPDRNPEQFFADLSFGKSQILDP